MFAVIQALVVYTFWQQGLAAWLPVSLLATAIGGAILGVLLLWYEVDRYNPALRKVCSGSGSKANCDAILQSNASGIFGISWSLVGFSYFCGITIALLTGGLSNPILWNILGWLSMGGLVYVIFSIYYQWRIAKQWCVLCLGVQGVLVAQAGIALAGQQLTVLPTFPMQVILSLLISFILPALASSWLITKLKQTQVGRKHKKDLTRLKHNPQIFQTLLEKQNTLDQPSHGLGIVLGNPNAQHHIIKVCNPYCGPCAAAHPSIDEILQSNPDVRVQIIFTATNDQHDQRTPPIKHLLAISEEDDEHVIKQALDDWYLAEKKDYAVFAAKYPMNGELDRQGSKLDAMRSWCDKTGITFTPTFFINGHQLPEMYTVSDLKYLLKT